MIMAIGKMYLTRKEKQMIIKYILAGLLLVGWWLLLDNLEMIDDWLLQNDIEIPWPDWMKDE